MRTCYSSRDLREALVVATLMLEAVIEHEGMIGLAVPLANKPRAGLDRKITG